VPTRREFPRGAGAAVATAAAARPASAQYRQVLQAASTHRLKAAGVEFVGIDTAAFREATGPVRDRYAARWPQLLERLEYTR
jgi:TRAP-type C4-dicarboxylate transport system substrate-binding protein